MGLAPHRRPRQPRDAALVHRGDRALRAAVRRRARGGRARPAPGVPVDEVRARPRGGRARRRPAPPRPPRRLPGRARRARAGGRRDLRRHRLRARRHGVGRRAAGRRHRAARSAPATCAPVRLPGGEQAVRQPWRMACAWLQEALGERPAAAARASTARRWEAVAALARGGLAAPVTTSMGRLFDAVAALCGDPAGGHLRGPGGDRARGGGRARRPRRSTTCPALRPAARPSSRSSATCAPAPTPASSPPASTTRSRPPPPTRVAAAASERGVGTAVLSGGVFLNRRLLEATAGAPARRRPARARPRAAARRATAGSPTARRRSPPLRRRERARSRRTGR